MGNAARRIRARRDLTARRKALLTMLAHRVDDGESPTAADLAGDTSTQLRSVQRLLRALEQDGEVRMGIAASGSRSATWTLVRHSSVAQSDAQIERQLGPRHPPVGGEAVTVGSEDDEGGKSTDRTATATNEENDTARVAAKIDPTQALPDGFPEALIEHARQVFRVLRDIARERGARDVTPRAVGRVMLANPGRHYVSEAQSMAAWIDDRPEMPVKDVTARYRTWLSRATRYAGVELLGEPAAGHANVTPIRRRRYGIASGEFREALDRIEQREREDGQ